MNENTVLSAEYFLPVSGIYTIHNLVTERIYVGRSANIVARWAAHVGNLSKNKHENPYLQADYNKYGASSLVLTVVLLAKGHKALVREEALKIKTLKRDNKDLYNVNNVTYKGHTSEAAKELYLGFRYRHHHKRAKLINEILNGN